MRGSILHGNKWLRWIFHCSSFLKIKHSPYFITPHTLFLPLHHPPCLVSLLVLHFLWVSMHLISFDYHLTSPYMHKIYCNHSPPVLLSPWSHILWGVPVCILQFDHIHPPSPGLSLPLPLSLPFDPSTFFLQYAMHILTFDLGPANLEWSFPKF